MVVPRPSAARVTVNVVPSAMEMCSLSLNLQHKQCTTTWLGGGTHANWATVAVAVVPLPEAVIHIGCHCDKLTALGADGP